MESAKESPPLRAKVWGNRLLMGGDVARGSEINGIALCRFSAARARGVMRPAKVPRFRKNSNGYCYCPGFHSRIAAPSSSRRRVFGL